MALSANTFVNEMLGDDEEYPVAASTTIYEGAMIYLDGGYAKPLAATKECAGVAIAKADNSSGSAGDINVKVRARNFARKMSVTDLTITSEGAAVYGEDDATVSLTAGSNKVCGVVRRYIADGSAVIEYTNYGVRPAQSAT